MTQLSIVIVNFNTKALTLACLASIKKYPPVSYEYEIIVVDNASTDGSVEALRKLSSRINLIENKTNLGFSKANNQGIQEAVGRHVLLLNSDTLVTKSAIDKLLKFAIDNPDAGVVGAQLLNSDNTIQSSCYNLPTIWRAVRQYWFQGEKILDKYTPKGANPVKVESVVGAAFLITPKALSRIGVLDEKYFMYFEDLDYCLKVNNAGLSVYYVPKAQIIHIHGASIAKVVNNLLVESSKKYFGIRYYPYTFILKTGQKLQKLFF